MARLPNGEFDSSQVDPSSREPIPDGEYRMQFSASDMKPTNSGNGQYLELVADVIDGPHKGRKIWTRLNLVNPNTTAVEIAQRELSAICRAVGVGKVNDSVQLHGKPFLAVVRIRPGKGDYRPTNEITEYKRLGMAPPTAVPSSSAPAAPTAAAPAPVAQPAPPAASSVPPWQQGAA